MSERFEYQVLHTDDQWGARTIGRLNELGSQGWRVVASITDSEQMGTAHATYSFTSGVILERRLEG